MDLDAVADADTEEMLSEALKQHSRKILVSKGFNPMSATEQARLLEVTYNLLASRSASHLESDEENSGFSCHYVSTEVIHPGEIVNWAEKTLKHAEVRAIDCNDVTAYNAHVSAQLQDPKTIEHMKQQVEYFAKIGLPYNPSSDGYLLQAINVKAMGDAEAMVTLMNNDFLNEEIDKVRTFR